MKATMRNLLFAAFAATLFAFPARATSYITDVMLIGGTKNEVNSLKSSLTSQGWQFIDQDLNKGAGGDYIYLLYKSGDSNDPGNHNGITDFFINNSSDYADEDTYNGRTYHLVPYDGGAHFKSLKGDLNSKANGADIHLYYTKEPFADKRGVTNITFNASSAGGVGTKGSTSGYDLNKYSGGDCIIMHTATYAPATGEMLSRYSIYSASFLVKDPEILAGLPNGATVVSVPQGYYFALEIPEKLKDAPGHPYTLVLKIKVTSSDGWVSLVNMPDSNNSDSMIYLYKNSRKVCIKQFDKSDNAGLLSDRGVELNRWTTLAFAFDTNATKIYLDGEQIFSGTGALAGSYADCYSAGENILIGADDDGEDNLFYLADARIYDGAVVVSDELLGVGIQSSPYRITSLADWELFVSNINRGMATGRSYPYYRLTTDLGSAEAPITNSVGTASHAFYGDFDGQGHTIYAGISGHTPGTALFARTLDATIYDLSVAGSISSDANYAAGLVGIGSKSTTIWRCKVSADISVSKAGYAGGIIGNGGQAEMLRLISCVFSGTISGFKTHAGGLIGWCDSLEQLVLSNCLFSGSFSGSGKVHPIFCMANGSAVPASAIEMTNPTYYLYTAASTEDAANIVPGVEGCPVSATRVPFEWTRGITAVDGNVYYKSAVVTLTPETPGLILYDGDILTGTGGPDTRVNVDHNARVILRHVNNTAITDDAEHVWGGVTCSGNATIILEGDNALKGGHQDVPGIFVFPDKTLVIQGDGTLDASSNGRAAGIGGGPGSGVSCGNIVIEGGVITATGGQYAAGIGCGFDATCGNITISGGTVTATGGQYAAGIGCSVNATCGDITISGGTVTATGGQYAAGIGSGAGGVCGDITFSGGTVTATGGEAAPGIGSGATPTNSDTTASCGTITIETGVTQVTATKGNNSTAIIGKGLYSTCGAVTVAEGLLDVTEGNTRTIMKNTQPPTPDNAYSVWAAANNVTGAWDAKDALGVPNVFRYLFGLPTGAFANPPLLAITIDAEGRAVIHTPPLSATATGFDLSILATDDLAGTGATVYPLDPSGKTVIPKTDSKTRFFRLKAAEK
ncbi:MAG: hypothetical protein J6336_07045 [Kiritimatiellae bacterium]|nr:hypothetical protein [Kiritimatiellia bacterium]